MNRLECVGETLRHTLNELSRVAPNWVQAHIPIDWAARYGQRFEQYHLPKTDSARRTLAETIGRDGYTLLTACVAHETPADVRHHPAVDVLRRVWLQDFWKEAAVGPLTLSATSAAGMRVQWREVGNLPPADQMIQSPYDVEAHYSRKRGLAWIGYKGHVTETCDPDQPYLLTHVETTAATRPDEEAIPKIQAALAAKDLLPAEHLVDAGYTTAEGLSS